MAYLPPELRVYEHLAKGTWGDPKHPGEISHHIEIAADVTASDKLEKLLVEEKEARLKISGDDDEPPGFDNDSEDDFDYEILTKGAFSPEGDEEMWCPEVERSMGVQTDLIELGDIFSARTEIRRLQKVKHESLAAFTIRG